MAVVHVKSERRLLRSGRLPWPISGVDEEQVRAPVVLDVDHRDAAAHRFRKQFLAVGAVVMNETDAGCARDIGVARRRNGNSCQGLRPKRLLPFRRRATPMSRAHPASVSFITTAPTDLKSTPLNSHPQ